jgi:hypothetical protein
MPGQQIVSDYPAVEELKPGSWFRGFELTENKNSDWGLVMKRGGQYPKGETWVRVDQSGIWFGKVVKGLEEANNAIRFWETNLEINGMARSLASKIDLGMDLYLVVSPDVGVDWDYHWSSVPWDEALYKNGLVQGMDAYEALYDRGLAIRIDHGPWQFTIDKNGRVMVTDFDTLVVADANGNFPASVANREAYLAQVRSEIQGDFSDQPIATPFAPPVQVNPPAPANTGSTTRVFIFSTVDKKPHVVKLTEEELRILRSGGDEAARMLATKGLPLPPISMFEKGLRVLGKGLEAYMYVWLGYEVSEIMWDVAGFGETVQVLPSTMGISTGNMSETALNDYNWLVAEGFESTVAFHVYQEDLDSVYVATISNGCRKLRLEFPFVTNLPGFPDADTLIPVQECANPSQVVLYDLTSGERIIWEPTEAGWQKVEGPDCFEYAAPVYNGVGNVVVSPFRTCVTASGITHTPIWTEVP